MNKHISHPTKQPISDFEFDRDHTATWQANLHKLRFIAECQFDDYLQIKEHGAFKTPRRLIGDVRAEDVALGAGFGLIMDAALAAPVMTLAIPLIRALARSKTLDNSLQLIRQRKAVEIARINVLINSRPSEYRGQNVKICIVEASAHTFAGDHEYINFVLDDFGAVVSNNRDDDVVTEKYPCPILPPTQAYERRSAYKWLKEREKYVAKNSGKALPQDYEKERLQLIEFINTGKPITEEFISVPRPSFFDSGKKFRHTRPKWLLANFPQYPKYD